MDDPVDTETVAAFVVIVVLDEEQVRTVEAVDMEAALSQAYIASQAWPNFRLIEVVHIEDFPLAMQGATHIGSERVIYDQDRAEAQGPVIEND